MSPIRQLLKNTRFQTIFILFAAFVIGAGTYIYLVNFQARLTQERELVKVYVARSEIASGTTFADIKNRSLLEVRELPAKSIPGDALRPEVTVESSFKTRGVLTPGQLLVSSFFTSEGMPEPTLPIPQGMLALTISVDDVGRVGNFVVPGSRVAIYSTASAVSGNPQVRVLLPEVLVIAIGDQVDVPDGISTLNSPLVTVALAPKDAERVILASQNARLTLALAHSNDPSEVLGLTGVEDARG